MKLGIISGIAEDDFRKAKDRNLDFIEIDVNDWEKEFFKAFNNTVEYSIKYQMPIGAIGRWGTTRITKEGINEEELAIEYQLIEAAAKLKSGIYITGCNYIEELSYYENCQLAISYFEKLIEHGKQYGVKIATYNCRWNNFVHSDMAWTMIHGYLKDLYIKYDTSHCIYDGGNYLKEARDWGDRFAYVHIKGALEIDGSRYDDPPAGLDQTNWRAFISILYTKGYDGHLSIEPHSEYWKNEIGEKGIDYTIKYIRSIML